MHRRSAGPTVRRRGTLLVITAALLVFAFGVVAYSVDVSYISAVRQELQHEANAVAVDLVAASQDVERRRAPGSISISEGENQRRTVQLNGGAAVSHEAGAYDPETNAFQVRRQAANAVRVTTRARNEPLFFAPIVGDRTFDLSRSAVAYRAPLDLVVLLDGLDSSLRATLATLLRELSQRNEGLPSSAVDRVAVMMWDGSETNAEPQFLFALTSDLDWASAAVERTEPWHSGRTALPKAGLKAAERVLDLRTEGGQARSVAERRLIVISPHDIPAPMGSETGRTHQRLTWSGGGEHANDQVASLRAAFLNAPGRLVAENH